MIHDDPRFRALPQHFAQRAKEFYARSLTAAATRRAATVVLLRDLPHTANLPGGMEVYLVRRAASMVFAGGLYAFPGGRMDDSDIDVASTAVREFREETGVTLHEMHAWSRWVTPEFEPRRYDTWFYVARQPDGKVPTNVGGEADWAGWLSPTRALREHGDSMLPPTAVTLHELSNHLTVDSVLAAAEARDLSPIRPVFVPDGDEPHLALPGDADYPKNDVA